VPVRILGIESSCDETAAAVVADGREILSSIVASQVEIHRKYGGVVPELASREHLRRIVPVVREALEQARLTLRDVDAVAVTRGPGLIGALLVGLTYGKVLALELGKPLVAVNHLEGHVHAVFLPQVEGQEAPRAPELPAVCLVVSGGHTVLYEVQRDGTRQRPAADGPLHRQECLCYRRIGQTRDDAAGEAYDKVAKLLALGYPGGPVIEQLAVHGDAQAVRFGVAKMKGNPFDFSFSGIKTAVFYHLRAHSELEPETEARRRALERGPTPAGGPAFAGAVGDDVAGRGRLGAGALRPAGGERQAEQLRPLCSQATLDLVASFQRCVVDDLVARTLAAAEQHAARSVLVSGGVAANQCLRQSFEEEARMRGGLEVFFPSRALSTDNAAMIAAAAYPHLLAGECADAELNAEANLPLA